MSHALGDTTPNVVTLVRHLGPKVHKSCTEWVQHSLSLQRYKGWAMSTVIYGIGSVEATISSQISIHDAVAPPSVRTGSYRVAPRMLAYKARRTKRRSHRGGGDGDDEGPEWDEGGFGGSGGWGGNDNGRGGNDYWGASWNEDGWWWEDASEAAFSFIYEVACWVSLTQCLQFLLKKLLDVVRNGVDESALDGGSFAQCSWVFVHSERGSTPLMVDHRMPRLTWPRSSS
ncbi:hypothetical protein GOP47_0005649 [Adiantum capillus-veneris]|uniref:Uncharacterized protein n=1 Tax=Adiantum capillus-veneris TaxID=13818 RepID=A0A9D4ZPB5_ADICA|nr:hypothetical protein GOP47_0005649 [Adiantum capillus-veneris]